MIELGCGYHILIQNYVIYQKLVNDHKNALIDINFRLIFLKLVSNEFVKSFLLVKISNSHLEQIQRCEHSGLVVPNLT